MKKHTLPTLAVSAAAFLLVLILLGSWLGSFGRENTRRQHEALERALNRNLLLCYSLEGRYPDTLEELLEKYPLRYDREQFHIDYRPLGGNLLPDITILEIQR